MLFDVVACSVLSAVVLGVTHFNCRSDHMYSDVVPVLDMRLLEYK